MLKGSILAAVELMDMAERVKVFPLVVLGALVVFGLLLWWAVSKSRAGGESVQAPVQPQARVRPTPPSTDPSEGAPPVAADPGQKILEGADGAYSRGMFETALKFYKDFELWYAGTQTYDRNSIRVFERIHSSGAQMKVKDETLPAYLATRRKAAEDWKRLQLLMASPPTDASRAELKAYEDALPPRDGRRALIDAWLSPDRGEK